MWENSDMWENFYMWKNFNMWENFDMWENSFNGPFIQVWAFWWSFCTISSFNQLLNFHSDRLKYI